MYKRQTDNRLLRRIVRDYKYRGYSAQETIRRWSSVRAGEEKWIFPYQENADVMFNSALLFELAALKNQALDVYKRQIERKRRVAVIDSRYSLLVALWRCIPRFLWKRLPIVRANKKR